MKDSITWIFALGIVGFLLFRKKHTQPIIQMPNVLPNNPVYGSSVATPNNPVTDNRNEPTDDRHYSSSEPSETTQPTTPRQPITKR